MALKWGKYIVKMKCPNCGFLNDARIPRGEAVAEFVNSKSFKCDNCGCFADPESYETKWLK